MGSQVTRSRDERALYYATMLRKNAREGFYGRITIFYENGFVTHAENTERTKPPIDMPKRED